MFAGFNEIYTLDNTLYPVTIQQLALEDRRDFYVFTMTPEKVSIGKIKRVDTVGLQPVVKVVLDDKKVLGISEHQVLILRDGTYKQIGVLFPGCSLMPLYLKQEPNGYVRYTENTLYHKGGLNYIDQLRSRKVSRMVAEFKLSARLNPSVFVEHINRNKLDCSPDNLRITEHKRTPKTMPRRDLAALEEARAFIAANIELTKKRDDLFITKDLKDKWKPKIKRLKRKRNHKIAEVTYGKPELVYNLVSEEISNTAVSGVFASINNRG
jgi:hypothetical protein